MIKFENLEIAGWEPSIRGMRNPKNSWAKSDSKICPGHNCDTCDFWRLDKSICSGNHIEGELIIGPNDHKLMMNLRNSGTDHRKYLRMIIVWVDIVAPLYWWKEFDTYKVGTVANSCSTMHTIHQKEFTLGDFSCEKLLSRYSDGDERLVPEVDVSPLRDNSSTLTPLGVLRLVIIPMLNLCREWFIETKDKKYWEQMIQLLPSSYNQRRTVMFSYENLANMFHSREFHKLDEWRDMCAWMKTLPYPELITGKVETNNENESI